MTNHPFESKGMVTDPGKVRRDLNLVSDYAKIQNIPLPTAVKDLERTYGKGLETFKPVIPEVQQSTRGKVAQFLFGNPGAEQELVDGKLMAKNRQKGLGRFTSGLSDALTLNLTDFDQRGGGFLGLKDINPLSGLGGKPTDYELPTTVKKTLQDRISDTLDGGDNPYGDIDALVDANLRYQREMDKISRKGRVVDNAMEIANIQAQLPLYANYFKDLSTFKQQQILDAEFAKQKMPDASEARKLSSATRFAGEATAIGNQYGKAVEGAKAGIRNPTATFSV